MNRQSRALRIAVALGISLAACLPALAGFRDGGRDSRGTRVDVGFNYSSGGSFHRGSSWRGSRCGSSDFFRTDISFSTGGFYRPVYRPVFVQQPVIVAPQPIFVPQPVIVQQPVVVSQPVFVQPAPVFVQQPVVVHQPVFVQPSFQCNDSGYSFTSVQFRFSR